MAVKGLTVGEVGGVVTCVGGGIVPAVLGQLLLGELFELVRVLKGSARHSAEGK